MSDLSHLGSAFAASLQSGPLAAALGAAFALLMTLSMRLSTAVVARAGVAGVAVAYGAFAARLFFTAAFFALVITLLPGTAVWAAAGFCIVAVVVPATDLVRMVRPRPVGARAVHPRPVKGGR